MADELRQKAEEYIKKDGTETEKLLNSVKLSLTREEATVLINAIKQSYIDGATEATKETELLSKHILELQADKGRLTDELTEAKKHIGFLLGVVHIKNTYNKEIEEEISKAEAFLKE